MSKLYNFLLNLQHCSNNDEFYFSGQKVKLQDLCLLSHNLFNQLGLKFQLFLSSLRDLSHSEHGSRSNLWSIVDDLTSVLRSCLIILTLLDSELDFLLEKCRKICQVLKVFVPLEMGERNERTLITFENWVSGDSAHNNVQRATFVSLEISDACRPFLCTVLEVFADEFLKHPSLRNHLRVVESSSSIGEKVILCHFDHGCIASVLEVVSAHLLLSVSDEQPLENFISTLLLDHGKDSRDPELSLDASISLLLNPVLISAPKILQAHVISLVSKAICDSKNLVPKNLFDCCLPALERSVTLYSMHVSCLQMDQRFYRGFKCFNHSHLLGRSQARFETYIQQVTRNKLNNVIAKLDDFWDSYQDKMSSKTKADLLTEYATFIKESQNIYADSYQDTVVSFLDCILKILVNDVTDLLIAKESTSAQDICLLASILNLMSISMVQVIRSLSNGGNLGCLETSGNASLCRRYDILISTLNCFQQFDMCLPIQKSLSDVMKSHQTKHKHSKSMLLHFSGLLSFSFSNGLDILAKACISVLMVLTYLFIFEEGDLTTLESSLRDLPLQSMSLDKAGKGAGNRTSYKVALNFRKVWASHSSINSPSSFQQGIPEKQAKNLSSVNIVNSFSSCYSEEETCNGDVYLDCLLGGSRKSSDLDLVDFIECKKGKDYHKWLKDRERYRQWRHDKVENLRKKRRKMIWKSLKCPK